jgi:L-amino acid N-acyltransferase YncA
LRWQQKGHERPGDEHAASPSTALMSTLPIKAEVSALLNALIDAAPEAGVWALQTGIFRENRASGALHEARGSRIVGRARSSASSTVCGKTESAE